MQVTPQLLKLMSVEDQAFYNPGVHPPYEEDHHPPQKTDRAEKVDQGHFWNYCCFNEYPAIWHAMHRPTKCTPGTPDFVVPVNGKTLYIEFKKVGGKLSEVQEDYKRKLEAQGHTYHVVYSCNEAIQLCREAGIKKGVKIDL